MGTIALLKNLVYMGKLKSFDPGIKDVTDLTETHIETYVRSIVQRASSKFDLKIFGRALKPPKAAEIPFIHK